MGHDWCKRRNPDESRVKRGFKIAGMVLLGIIGAVALAFLFGIVIRELWNWLMPAIFNLGKIDYWQAVGLFILGKLLFGGFGHGGGGNRGKMKKPGPKYKKYWKEEGQAAYEAWMAKCGPAAPPEKPQG